MCAPSSSRITELLPTTGSSTRRAPSPGRRTSGGAVKTCFTSSGSVIITNGGVNGNRIVNRFPYRARQLLQEGKRSRPEPDHLQ